MRLLMRRIGLCRSLGQAGIVLRLGHLGTWGILGCAASMRGLMRLWCRRQQWDCWVQGSKLTSRVLRGLLTGFWESMVFPCYSGLDFQSLAGRLVSPWTDRIPQ